MLINWALCHNNLFHRRNMGWIGIWPALLASAVSRDEHDEVGESKSIRIVDVVDASESVRRTGFLPLDLLSPKFVCLFCRWNPKARAQARRRSTRRMTATTRERMVKRSCSLSSIKSVTTWTILAILWFKYLPGIWSAPPAHHVHCQTFCLEQSLKKSCYIWTNRG